MNNINYTEIMHGVKKLDKLPNLNAVTIAMAADYFEVSVNAINNYYYPRRSELESCGVFIIDCEDLIKAGYERPNSSKKIFKFGDTELRINHAGLRCLTDEAMFKIAMGLNNSSVAQRIREVANENLAADDDAEEDLEQDDSRNIQTFTHSDFGSIRMITINGLPWFVGKDIADILKYTNTQKAIRDHVDDDDKLTERIVLSGQNRNMIVINESGMYSLILSSKLPSAKQFKRWVTSEVLPSIRKYGAYMTPETLEKAILNPDFLIELANKLKEEQEKNAILSAANKELATANKALSDDHNTWEKNSVLTALIRSYAVNCCKGSYAIAYDHFYKHLAYKLHINLKARKTRDKEGRDLPWIKYIRADEINGAIQVAAAMCESKGINIGNVINSVNQSVYVG